MSGRIFVIYGFFNSSRKKKEEIRRFIAVEKELETMNIQNPSILHLFFFA